MTAGALIAFAAPAGATTQQQKLHLDGVPIDIGSALPCLAGDIVIQGNAHDHFFTNPNGDFWENATIEGAATLVDPSTGAVLEVGTHGEAWFGIESNNGAMVNHFKDSVNFPGVQVFQSGQFVVLPNGNVHITRFTTTCG
jgi:hypothetical protein